MTGEEIEKNPVTRIGFVVFRGSPKVPRQVSSPKAPSLPLAQRSAFHEEKFSRQRFAATWYRVALPFPIFMIFLRSRSFFSA